METRLKAIIQDQTRLPFVATFHSFCLKTIKENLVLKKRLFYVPITRAKEQIYITYAKKRRIYGKTKLRTISPFVADIEARLRKHETSISIKKHKENQVQLSLF